MDGFKEKLKRSIQFRISFWLTVIIAVVGLLSIAFSYTIAFHEAGEIQDGALTQMAILVSNNKMNPEVDQKRNTESGILIQYIPNHSPKGSEFIIPSGLSNGFHQITFNNKPYRVLVYDLSNQLKVAQKGVVAQPTKLRDELVV